MGTLWKTHQRARSFVPVGDCDRLWGHMQLRLMVPVCLQRSLLLIFCIVPTGCHSSSKLSAPTLAFSKVAAAYQENPYKRDITERDYKTDIIDGRVTGARPGQRIVLYAKTDGRWGLCRQAGQPFTNFETDGRWKASVHLGIQYAALLVDPTYTPPEQTESLPSAGNGVTALAVVNGDGPAPVLPSPKIVNFSGYEWTASAGPIFHAGSRNFFDPANVWTDERGALHLRISGSPGKWNSAELKLTRSLGYGTYRFQVRDASRLEPSAVLTLITWDGVGTEFFFKRPMEHLYNGRRFVFPRGELPFRRFIRNALDWNICWSFFFCL